MSIFTDHPHAIGESYGEHLVSASRFGGRLIVAGLACITHGIFPFWCKSTGSRAVHRLPVLLHQNGNIPCVIPVP